MNSARTFLVILTPEEDGSAFNVTVPSLPGCVTWGPTVEEALAMVKDAIELYLADEADAPDDETTIVATVAVKGPEKVPA